jgi:hypothetical protein
VKGVRNMIKVIKQEFNDLDYSYEFTLENNDIVIVEESNYNRIVLHNSNNGKTYRAIVDEHEDDFEEPIEYIGFELIG